MFKSVLRRKEEAIIVRIPDEEEIKIVRVHVEYIKMSAFFTRKTRYIMRYRSQ